MVCTRPLTSKDPLTSTGPGLSASTSPWAASLYCRGDSITSSFLTLLLFVLHLSACILTENTSQKASNQDSCESQAVHACQWPEEGKETGFPGTRVSGTGWVCGACGVGRHDSKGQPPGVLLLLGKWEVPVSWPKKNKPQTEQYTVYWLFDKDQPYCVCSTQSGPNQSESK